MKQCVYETKIHDIDDLRKRLMLGLTFISWPTFTLLSLPCVWSVITAHNLTPEKRDNNYTPHPLTPTTCLRNNIQLITGISPCSGCLFCTLKHALVLRLVGLVPCSSVSLLLWFSAMLSVSLVSRVTARSLHDNMFGCQSPSGEWSWNK